MKNAMVEAALRYAERGWPVFPCEPGGKRPITRRGLHDATTDRDEIERLWRADRHANVGIRTGHVSGLVVLDVDGEEGSDALYLLEREFQELPRTAASRRRAAGPTTTTSTRAARSATASASSDPGWTYGRRWLCIAPPSVGPNVRR